MREKLIDIIVQTPCVAVSSRTAAGRIADNLIANGVTMKKLTNADLFRARNDYELAESIASFVCDINEGVEYSDNPNDWLEWLQRPAEVDDGTHCD